MLARTRPRRWRSLGQGCAGALARPLPRTLSLRGLDSRRDVDDRRRADSTTRAQPSRHRDRCSPGSQAPRTRRAGSRCRRGTGPRRRGHPAPDHDKRRPAGRGRRRRPSTARLRGRGLRQGAPAGQKREDLLVQDASWVSVTEVKGYEKGNAKQNDLLQLGSAVESYLLRTSRAPDARWYVVNQNFRTPAGLRQQPLAGAGDTVAKFTAQNGLVIDTRDLFRLTRAVASGEVDAAEARRQLRDARGVFDYPAQTTGGE